MLLRAQAPQPGPRPFLLYPLLGLLARHTLLQPRAHTPLGFMVQFRLSPPLPSPYQDAWLARLV